MNKLLLLLITLFVCSCTQDNKEKTHFFFRLPSPPNSAFNLQLFPCDTSTLILTDKHLYNIQNKTKEIIWSYNIPDSIDFQSTRTDIVTNETNTILILNNTLINLNKNGAVSNQWSIADKVTHKQFIKSDLSKLYFLNTRQGQFPVGLICLDLNSKEKLWYHNVIYTYAYHDDYFIAFEENSVTPKWTILEKETGDTIFSQTITDTTIITSNEAKISTIIPLYSSYHIFWIDSKSSKLVWKSPKIVQDEPFNDTYIIPQYSIIDKDIFVYKNDSSIVALNIKSKKTLWKHKLETSNFKLYSNKYCFVSLKDKVLSINKKGEILKSDKITTNIIYPDTKNGFFYHQNDTIYHLIPTI